MPGVLGNVKVTVNAIVIKQEDVENGEQKEDKE